MVNASLGFGLTNVPHHMLNGVKGLITQWEATRQDISSGHQVLTAGLNISIGGVPWEPSVQKKRLSSVKKTMHKWPTKITTTRNNHAFPPVMGEFMWTDH